MAKTGLLGNAFFVTYMFSAPILGRLADRFSRWIIIGLLWSFGVWPAAAPVWRRLRVLFITRVFVGIGEGGYGPAAPTILLISSRCNSRPGHGRFLRSDPRGQRAWLRLGGLISDHLGWRWATYLVIPPGLLLGLFCFFQSDPRVAADHLAPKELSRTAAYTTI